MKRNMILLVMFTALAGLVSMQSCTKPHGPGYTEHYSFTTPVALAPISGTVVNLGDGVLSGNVSLQWNSTNQSGDAINGSLYFGTSSKPALYASSQTAESVSVPVHGANTYYWYVIMTDANGITTTGPTWSFTVYHPMNPYIGDYTCDEPAEDYTYDITFAMKTDYVLETVNYWNSGWTADWTLDYTAKTYTMPLTTWGSYSAQESGTIDPSTGTMTGNYTIFYKGSAIETGTHTYTRNTK